MSEVTRIQLSSEANDLNAADDKSNQNGVGTIPMQSDRTMKIQPGHQGGTISVVTRDGATTTETRGVERYEPAKLGNNLEGFMSTGRQLSGAAINCKEDILDSTRFNVHGIELDARSAAAAGFLVREAANIYSLPKPVEGEAAPEAAPAEEPFTDHLPKPVLDALSELDVNLGSPKATDSAVAGSIAYLAKGDIEGAVKDFTGRTGLDPETSRTYVEGIMFDARESIKTRLQEFGVPNGEDCLQHLEATLSPSAKASLALELFSGSNAAFRRVAEKFTRHMSNTVVGAELYAKVK